VTQGGRIYLLKTKSRVDALADDSSAFLPELEDLYCRITFR